MDVASCYPSPKIVYQLETDHLTFLKNFSSSVYFKRKVDFDILKEYLKLTKRNAQVLMA